MGHNWVHKGSYVNKLFGGALYTKTSTQNIVAQEDLELSQMTYLPQPLFWRSIAWMPIIVDKFGHLIGIRGGVGSLVSVTVSPRFKTCTADAALETPFSMVGLSGFLHHGEK